MLFAYEVHLPDMSAGTELVLACLRDQKMSREATNLSLFGVSMILEKLLAALSLASKRVLV